MVRPTSRVLALLEVLQAGGVHPVSELAQTLGVDERTVRRYVGHLLDLDVPVESLRGRYGGYRLGRGFRMPPLMLTDAEAMATLLGLRAGRAGGDADTAAAKIRRVLPRSLGEQLDAVLAATAFTGEFAARPDPEHPPQTRVLLTIAAAVRDRHPVALGYRDREGTPSERTVEPYGIVANASRWYLTGADSASGEVRTFRIDRISGARRLPGSFEPPAGFDAAAQVLAGIAGSPHAHAVSIRVRDDPSHVRTRFPAGIALVDELEDGWLRLRLSVAELDWIPPTLAALDRPFVIEEPAELQGSMRDFAARLVVSAT